MSLRCHQAVAPLVPLLLLAGALAGCAMVPVSVRGNPDAGWGIVGYVGKSSMSAAPNQTVVLKKAEGGAALATTTTDIMGKYEFLGLRPGSYVLVVGPVKRGVKLSRADLRVDIDLSKPTGEMDYLAGALEGGSSTGASSAGGGSGGGASAPAPGPNDEDLMRWIAGHYFGFSGAGVATGGTERNLVLCAGGRFHFSTESGYSGGAGTAEAWGTASQSGHSGRWSIQGTRRSGRIHLGYSNGEQETLSYEAGPEEGCFSFNGATMCYKAAARCG